MKHYRIPIIMLLGILLLISLIAFLSCSKKEACLTCPQPPTDTTSHNFSWATQTFGDGSSSVLYDCAIINDTLAYAVGAIYFKDSLGNWDPNPFNLVKWDGHQWELKRVPFIGSCSAVLYPSIKTIWAFSDNSMLLSNGGSIVTYDGTNAIMDCRMNSLLTGAINKIYAINPQNVYIVGNAGTIVFYNGSNWTKIESGTTLSINDIYGGYNATTKQWEILAVATQNYPAGRAILSINGNTATQISSNPIGEIQELFSVWFVPCQQYYVIGDGIFQKNSLSDGTWRNNPLDITHYATTRIRGNGINDVFVVGAYGEVLHFNGSTWKSYISTTNLPNGSYASIAVKNNLVIAVGFDYPLGVVAIGKR